MEERKEEKEEKGEYKLKINLFGLAIPIGIIIGGISAYLLLGPVRLRILGLLLAVIGVLSILGLSVPLVQLKKAKTTLKKQERKVKLERMNNKVKSEKEGKG